MENTNPYKHCVFLKLLVKQNSAIGASAPVVDPVVKLIGWIAIRRDLLRSLLLDIVQMDPHPEKKKATKRIKINPPSINMKSSSLVSI